MKIRTCDFWKCQVISLLSLCSLIAAQLKYSVLEETEPGTLVGNVVKDLGLNTLETSKRGLQLGTEESRHYFILDLEKGVLNVKNKIDREKLCGTSLSCVLTVQLVIENPLELFHFEVEILDINDNSPTFQSKERRLKITELAQVGARFPLERAHDADVGNNAVSSYKLDHNQCFSLIVQNHKGDRPSPVLVLSKSLDREEESQYQLVLTALDGGNPTRTGTILISIIVLDINDNAPFFDNAVYKISLKEHVPVNTIVIQLNATDKDEGENGEISYYFEDQTLEHIFSLDHHTGEIRVKGNVDFEEYSSYEMTVKATDHGVPEMQGYCVVQVDVEDINDNEPEIHISSVLGSIAENAPIGSTIGLLSIKDVDTGKNGEVNLKMSPNLPFKITSVQNMYSIITNKLLDRENNSHYSINLIATDSGSPQLHSEKTIYLQITDINDNPPMFNNSFINIFIQENNDPGFLLSTVSASDIDEGENSHITYSILNSVVDGSPAKTFIYINQQNGAIFAQQSFDFERFQVLQFTVRAEDSGSPKLCSNITIFLYILDKNDNYPLILYPEISLDLKPHQLITKSLPIGSLVTKVIAIDADSGYNAWLSYTLIKETEPSLFNITPHTGEIRTTRRVQETDSPIQSLCILIKDNGKPPLSSTTTLIISLVDSVSKESYHSKDFLANTKESPDLTMYLVISLAAISVLSVVTFIILFAKCLNNKMGKSNCCFLKQSNASVYLEHSQKTLQLIPNGTLKYLEVTMASSDQKNKIYTSEVNRDTLNIIKSLNFPQLKNFVNENETLSRQSDFMEQMQQAQPNTDWRFSQAQRPGTSGAQPTEEAGVWPNNQFETERLQAMILASANEAAEGTSALGGGTGTMGLSARYGPQFTLQHVPDYRQNIYIPGTTSTLTNAAGKRDGKGAGPSGNKKKSGKKEKK